MSRLLTMSATAQAAVAAPETAEEFIVLLEITHVDLAAPVRLVDYKEAVVHGGNSYTPIALRFRLPDESRDKLPEVLLEIDNVERLLVEKLRPLGTAPTVTAKVVLASSPNVVEIGPLTFTMVEIGIDALVFSARLEFESLLDEPIPSDRFTPGNFPALFE